MTRSAFFLPPLAMGAVAAPWIKSVALAAALAGAVSIGLAASPLAFERADEASGAETFIELAVLTESASSTASEASRSDAEERPPAPDVDEAQARKVEHDLPTEQASPVPPDEDDLRMAQERTQRLSERANEEDQASEAMKAQTAVVSSQASEPSESSDGKPDNDVATAPEHGNSADGRRRIEQWQRRLFGHIARHKVYPEAARKTRASGEAVLAFHITRNGVVSDVRVLKSSGHAALDGAALDVMRRASPVPALPRELEGETFGVLAADAVLSEMNGPVCLADYERLAEERLPATTAAYLFGGAGEEVTLRANATAFEHVQLWPSIPERAEPVDLETRLFGDVYAAPVFAAPVAYQKLFHPAGEIASAQASAAMGAGYVLSTLSSTDMRDVRRAGEGAPQWFQLYFQPAPEDTLALLRRAEQEGFSAIVVTIDAALSGVRTREMRAGFALPADIDAVNLRGFSSDTRGLHGFPSWEALARLRTQTRLPLLVKGVLRPADAARAVDLGMDGVIVSNHGGRILDGAPSAFSCLGAVVEAVAGRAPVLFDSGIRRGADVVKCLKLGAAAVLVGRPIASALAVNGAQGAAHALRILIEETAVAKALCA